MGNADWRDYQQWLQQGILPRPAQTLAELKDELCGQLDRASDGVRLMVWGDSLRAAEYQRAAAAAQSYRDAGYKGEPPPAVRSWAEAKDFNGREAADGILAKAAACEQALHAIRDLRLKGKEAVRKAPDETTARAAADAALAGLHALSGAPASGQGAALSGAGPAADSPGRWPSPFKFFSKRL